MNKMQEIEWLNTPASKTDMTENRRYLVLVDYGRRQEWALVFYGGKGSEYVVDGNRPAMFQVGDLLEIGLLPEAK